jgi:hypothetical protein
MFLGGHPTERYARLELTAVLLLRHRGAASIGQDLVHDRTTSQTLAGALFRLVTAIAVANNPAALARHCVIDNAIASGRIAHHSFRRQTHNTKRDL